jgi:hypothetical protein
MPVTTRSMMKGPGKVLVDPRNTTRILLPLTRDPNTMQYKWKNDHRKAAGDAL